VITPMEMATAFHLDTTPLVRIFAFYS